MVGVRCVRRFVIALVSALVVLGPAGVATAAPPPGGAITITTPIDEATGDDVNVQVAGTAKRATTVVITVAGDPNTYETWVVKGQWGTLVNSMPAGTTQICAEAFDAGVSIGRTCITYTAAVDGQYLSLFPDDGASVQSTFTAGGGCHGGSTVRLTLDGQSEEIFCDSYQYYRRYVDVPEGEHTLAVEQLALDGSTVVASITHTFASAPVPVATVAITSPEDGSTGDWTELVISGTESSNIDPTVQIYVDGVYTTGATATDGQWSAPVTVDWGTHEICARKVNWQGDSIADDCIVHTVELLDTSLSITSPGDGSIQQTFVAVEGTCVGDLYVELAVDGEQDQSRQCLEGRWSTSLFLADGTHTLTARMSAGGTTVTDSVSVMVDSVPPATPVVVSPPPGSTLTSTPVTLTGTTSPGARVTVYDATSNAYRSATADSSGSWTLTLDRDFFATAGVLTGRRSSVAVGLMATDAAGNSSDYARVTYQTRLR
nr:Ig-like domain-containing protein [uncultured Nocardioides sp.]